MGRPDPVEWATRSKVVEPSREIRRIVTRTKKWKDKRTRPEHLFIPDTQVHAGVPIEHVRWAAEYALDKRPDVIVVGGDWWDFPSLNNYELNFADFRTRDFAADLLSGLHAKDLFWLELQRDPTYRPLIVWLEGNHDERFRRQFTYDVRMQSSLRGPKALVREIPGVVWVPWGEIISVDGIHYSHAFFNPMTSKPYGGTALHKLTKLKFSYVQGHCQGKDTAEQFLINGTVIRGLVAGCLTPDHKVLTADLRYVPIGDMKVGDKIVSFDESLSDSTGRSRRFKTGTFTKLARDVAEVFAVRLASSKTFKVTGDHIWLTKNSNSVCRWQTTAELTPGKTSIPRVLDEWEPLTSYDAGWLAGMYDGEGHLYARTTSGGSVAQLGISQKRGPTLDRITSTLADVCGQSSMSSHVHNDVMCLRVKGGVRNIAKVLGQLRPGRLLSKFRPELLGTMGCARGASELDRVVSVTPLGPMEIVRSLVDRGTLIVEGYPHHNSFYQHDEDYRGASGNLAHWRGMIYMHEVRDGAYDLMEVSMDYLRRAYGGRRVYASKSWRADEFTFGEDES